MDEGLYISIRENKQNLQKLTDEIGVLSKTQKELMSTIKQTMSSYSSYYDNTSGIVDSLLRRTGNVKENFKELNALTSQQIEQTKKYGESVNELSKKYGISSEEVTKNIKFIKEHNELLEKHKNLKEEVDKLQEKEKNGTITNDEKEKLGEKLSLYFDIDNQVEKVNKSIEKMSYTEQRMLNDQEKFKDAIAQYDELEKTTEKVNEAQKKLNKSIEEGKEKYKNFKKTGLADILGGLKDVIFGLAKGAMDKYKEIDQAGRDFGRNMGMSADELDRHTKNLIRKNGDLAKKLGMEFKDMYKFQIGYADATQKAVMLTTTQVGTMASLTRNTGEEAVNVATKNLDIFASSADATIEYLAKGTSRASLEGLNVKKYSEAFANNIKMASKYTFKEGITGIQKMTLLSQRLKFNMESIGAAMDKFSTLEGAIEASAKIQVLGGSFANNFGNPLEVMSEALLDAEGFTKRIIDTIASNAKFDKKTGEVNLAPIEKQRLKHYADALGISYDEVFNMTTQTRKSKEIERAVGKGKFTEEEISYLANKSQYNKETGKWELIDVEGGKHNIDELTKDSLNVLRNVDTHEKLLNSSVSKIKELMMDNAEKQQSIQENITGINEFVKSEIASWLTNWPNFTRWLMLALGVSSGLGIAGGLASIAKGGLKFGSGGFRLLGGLFGGGVGSATAVGAGTSATVGAGTSATVGGANGLNTMGNLSRARQLVLARQATNNMTKFVRGKGGVLAVIGGGLGVYSSMSDYSDMKKEILNSDMTYSEKKTAIAKAKVERNKGVGGSVGGAAGGWLGAMGGVKAGGTIGASIGAAFGGVGAVPGAFIGSIIGGIAGGLGGGWLGNVIGESVGEAVSDNVDDIKDENDKNGEIGILTEIKNVAVGIQSKVDKMHNIMLLYSGEEPIRGGQKNKNGDFTNKISVSDIKVNVSGNVRLVADNKMINIGSLFEDKTFKTEICRIVQESINKTPINRQPAT